VFDYSEKLKLDSNSYLMSSQDNIICPDGKSACPSGNTCCFSSSTSQYFCCPVVDGTCCADGKNCCPVSLITCPLDYRTGFIVQISVFFFVCLRYGPPYVIRLMVAARQAIPSHRGIFSRYRCFKHSHYKPYLISARTRRRIFYAVRDRVNGATNPMRYCYKQKTE
jgi:hypothetical protein